MPTIKVAETPADIKRFVAAASINRANPLWVPPIRKSEEELLTPGKHPFWETATRKLFIALRDGEPVGRVAAIVDEKYNAYAGEKCGGFGFFECENDSETANALLDAAKDWLVGEKMTFMRGPLNPSANYSCGTLVGGFELPPALMMPWNPPYYPELIEGWGARKEEDLFAYVIEREKATIPAWIRDEIGRIADEFTCRPSGKKTLAEDIRVMLKIYRESWANNRGFSPLSPGEEERHVKELKEILDPDFFVLFFRGDEPAGGMVALPDINPLLKRLDGKIGLTAPWHYWRARKKIREGYRIMLFGIQPEYRLRGLPLLLFDYMLKAAAKRPEFRWLEGSWVLEENVAVDDLIEDFGGVLAKRYRIYRRELGAS